MSIHYNQNHSREEITTILEAIQDCVREGRYVISLNDNRHENKNFINEHNLNSRRQMDILLNIEVEDFCHSLQNTNVGYEHEVLHVFCPQVMLFNFDSNEELVDIYTKFNLIEISEGKRTIVISFHKRNKPISYLFR